VISYLQRDVAAAVSSKPSTQSETLPEAPSSSSSEVWTGVKTWIVAGGSEQEEYMCDEKEGKRRMVKRVEMADTAL
jgi:hypothetical protein